MAVPQSKPHNLYGRDAEVETGMKTKGNVVKTYHFGNATIYICDDCIVKTPEEKEQVVEAFYNTAWDILQRAAERGEDI